MSASYHHGSLREALIAEGRRQLEAEGVHAISLRGLAKRIGVSHSAPVRHFSSRDELIDAIAADGFADLARRLAAADTHPGLSARLSTYAYAHVRFAVDNGALMQLMFAGGPGVGRSLTKEAAERFFALGRSMLGERDERGPGVVPYLLAATLEGISALVIAGRLPLDQVDRVVDAAVQLMLPAIEKQLAATDIAGPPRE